MGIHLLILIAATPIPPTILVGTAMGGIVMVGMVTTHRSAMVLPIMSMIRLITVMTRAMSVMAAVAKAYRNAPGWIALHPILAQKAKITLAAQRQVAALMYRCANRPHAPRRRLR